MTVYAFDKLKWCVVIVSMLGLSYQLLFALSGIASGLHTFRSETCKAHPGTAFWPSTGTWAALNQTLDGRLLQPPPPGAVCHPDQPTYNASQCANVAEEWKTYEFHAENPISVMWDQYDNSTCLPEMNTTCSPAGYPAYVVNASSAEHVKISIDFGNLLHIVFVLYTACQHKLTRLHNQLASTTSASTSRIPATTTWAAPIRPDRSLYGPTISTKSRTIKASSSSTALGELFPATPSLRVAVHRCTTSTPLRTSITKPLWAEAPRVWALEVISQAEDIRFLHRDVASLRITCGRWK